MNRQLGSQRLRWIVTFPSPPLVSCFDFAHRPTTSFHPLYYYAYIEAFYVQQVLLILNEGG
jgi:hypothetical protein